MSAGISPLYIFSIKSNAFFSSDFVFLVPRFSATIFQFLPYSLTSPINSLSSFYDQAHLKLSESTKGLSAVSPFNLDLSAASLESIDLRISPS